MKPTCITCTADCVDAADIISTLQAENKKLRAELEQVKNERDSAKATLHWLKLHGQKEGCLFFAFFLLAFR